LRYNSSKKAFKPTELKQPDKMAVAALSACF
jgi:hypothetical protein